MLRGTLPESQMHIAFDSLPTPVMKYPAITSVVLNQRAWRFASLSHFDAFPKRNFKVASTGYCIVPHLYPSGSS